MKHIKLVKRNPEQRHIWNKTELPPLIQTSKPLEKHEEEKFIQQLQKVSSYIQSPQLNRKKQTEMIKSFLRSEVKWESWRILSRSIKIITSKNGGNDSVVNELKPTSIFGRWTPSIPKAHCQSPSIKSTSKLKETTLT